VKYPPLNIDVRVWLTRPHVAAVEFPMSAQSSALLVEVDEGLHFRWQWLAISQVVHMECLVKGVSVVILNAYHGPHISRGARGTAGSGRGARTLLEGLSLSMVHNHWMANNHIDLHAFLPLPPGDEDGEIG
ncbi:unnamed protein product, partial [Discosporangium mesarthrocarpum]